MHSAPSVLYPLGRSRFLGCLLFADWLIVTGITVLWWRASATADWRPLLCWAALLIAAWFVANSWSRAPVGRLQWDGQRLRLESLVYPSGTALEVPVVVFNVQFALLLRLDNLAGAVWWLWAEWLALPARWLDLRRVVYAQYRPTTLQDSDAADRASGELAATVGHTYSAPALHL